MGTVIDTSSASAHSHDPTRALVQRTTVRVPFRHPSEGPRRWLPREAWGRLLARDPRTTTIRRAVGWSSLAGAALGVVLAFVASEPEDDGRPTPGWRSGASLALERRPLARAASPRQPPGGAQEPTRTTPLSPPAMPAPPVPTLLADVSTGNA
ncbi:MAG TPA: hypothetical protein VIU64_02115, partial [Polyangia bacterium]